MARTPYVDRNGLKKGTWTREEDMRLVAYVSRHGCRNWRQLPREAGLARCGKSCRLRWLNYLRPDIKRGSFTKEEEAAIFALHEKLGNKWSVIATHMPGRTDNEIKNFWNTHLRKLQPRHEPLENDQTPYSNSGVNVATNEFDASDEVHHQSPQMSETSWAAEGTPIYSPPENGGDDQDELISDDFWSQPFSAYGEDEDQYTVLQSEVYSSATDERDMLWFYHTLMNYS